MEKGVLKVSYQREIIMSTFFEKSETTIRRLSAG